MFDTTIRRVRLALAPVLVAGGLALAQPALGADYCVVGPNDPCNGTKLGDLQTALDAAAVDNLPDRIVLAAGTYNAPPQGFIYDPQGGGPVEIAGAGDDKTILAGASGAYRTLAVFGGAATSIHGLRVVMPPNAPTDAQALRTNGVVKNVYVTENPAQQQNLRTGLVLTGSGVFEDGSVALDDQGMTLGAQLVGGGTVRTSTIYASRGVTSGGGTIDRANIGTDASGVEIQRGTTKITSTKVRTFRDGSVAIAAGGVLDGDALVEIDGATLIGPDNPTSGTAIEVDNAYVPTVKADAVVKNTVIRFYPSTFWAGGYAPGHAHIGITYSDYDSSTKTVAGATGTIDESNVSYVGNVGFFDLEDLSLRPDSPLVDAGDPATSQGLDLDGDPLVTDGNGDGVGRRDIGALETPGVPLKPAAAIPPATSGGDQPVQPLAEPTPPARDTLAPALTGLRLSHKIFAVGRARTAIAARTARGTRVSYKLSENAKVVVKIQRVGKKRLVGKLTRTAKSGRNVLAFSGRIGAKALRPGRYRAVITAVDAAGNRSAPQTVRFRIAVR
jgi:hypothetical protein